MSTSNSTLGTIERIIVKYGESSVSDYGMTKTDAIFAYMQTSETGRSRLSTIFYPLERIELMIRGKGVYILSDYEIQEIESIRNEMNTLVQESLPY